VARYADHASANAGLATVISFRRGRGIPVLTQPHIPSGDATPCLVVRVPFRLRPRARVDRDALIPSGWSHGFAATPGPRRVRLLACSLERPSDDRDHHLKTP
jgi:hypothetical protein